MRIGIEKQRLAFTLAEVLITLGIIGVVAAMTIPTLITNINSAKYKVQFKKVISTLNQAALLGQANFDLDYAASNAKCSADEGDTEIATETFSFCSIFNSALSAKKFVGPLTNFEGYSINVPSATGSMNVVPVAFAEGDDLGTFDVTTSNYLGYTLSDGSLIAFHKNAKGCALSEDHLLLTPEWMKAHPECIGFVDVNGETLPNKVVNCEGVDPLKLNTGRCVVKGDPSHSTDIYPVVFHNTTVEPATPAGAYLLSQVNGTVSSDRGELIEHRND